MLTTGDTGDAGDTGDTGKDSIANSSPFLVAVLRVFVSLWLILFSNNPANAQDAARTDPNAGLFPDSSVIDFSYLLDAPAGRHGFLRVNKGGRFAWQNGNRAKFWGVNISNRSIWVTKDTIDKVADVLARAGANMVRFEAVDSFGALLDIEGSDSTRSLDRRKMAILDYWVAKLRERGIYYYFDLLDFRQFKPGDEVPGYDQLGRAAKPYAFFDRRLIDLQKEFAYQLLTHRNPITGLRYVDDPALALVEICNEHGLFFKAEKLDSLVEPYGAQLRQLWNQWLLQQYGSRDGIKSAWGMVSDSDVLQSFEDPGSYSVNLPLFTAPVPPDPGAGPIVADVRRAPIRLRDGVRFLYETQRGYFREMKTALRDMGLKVPITGVVSNEFAPDVASVAAECDFTSENYYADHPTFAGKEWEGQYFYNDTNPLRNSSPYYIAPWLAVLRWDNKPVVAREWATVWPNRYRAIAVPEIAAYAGLQDLDAVLLFGYQLAKDPHILSDFDHQCDPVVWGLFGLGAQAFLRGDVAAAPYTLTLEYTPDLLFRWPNSVTNLHRAAWFVRLNSTLAMKSAAQRKSTPPSPPYKGMVRGGAVTQRPNDPTPQRPNDPTTQKLASRGRNRQAVLKKPAPTAENPFALTVPADNSTSLSDLLDRFGAAGAPVSHRMLENGILGASNGQVVRFQNGGMLGVETPRTIALCGEIPVNRALNVGSFTLVSPTSIGALMAVSLDGRELKSSRHFVVKMVSRAENTNQMLDPAPAGAPGRFRLKDWGKAPVLTFGRPGKAMILKHNGKPILSLALEDGTWELVVKNGKGTLVCDTGGIRGTLLGRSITTTQSIAVIVDPNSSRPIVKAANPLRILGN